MIIYPPVRFDWNEWIVMPSAILLIIFAMRLPKRFHPAQVTFLLLYNIFMGQTVDLFLGAPPIDLYDMNDRPNFDFTDFVLYVFSYPAIAYIMLHFYDRWRIKGSKIIFYILGWSILTISLEWLADLAHVFTYKGWHLRYSLLVYIGVYTSLILMFHLSKMLVRYRK